MSPKQHKKIYFGFFYIILTPTGFDQEAEVEVVVTQGSYVFGRQLVQNQVSLPCKMLQFLGDFTGQT